MAKETFNEPERFLIRHWSEARDLEESIAEARQKYQLLCEKVAETVRERHDDLDEYVEVTRFSGPKAGVIVLGKPSWPREKRFRTGFWIENLRLEYLADEDKPPPLAYLWINHDHTDVTEAEAKRAILAAVPIALTPAEQARITTLTGEDYLLGIEFAKKQELIDMLAGGDSSQLVDTMVEQLELLAKLSPTLDALFPKE